MIDQNRTPLSRRAERQVRESACRARPL